MNEIIELLESKKANLLAQLLLHQNPTDIPFEKFENYNDLLIETIQSPDFVSNYKDNMGDLIFRNSKVFNFENEIIYILAFYFFDQNDKGHKYLILGFPTRDFNLYENFLTGKKISTILEN